MSGNRKKSIYQAIKLFAELSPERQAEALRFLALLQTDSFSPAKKPGRLAEIAGTLKPKLADEMRAAVQDLCEHVEISADAKS